MLRYLVDWIAETSEDIRLDCATLHVAAFYLDRVLLKAHDNASGRCQVPKHLWQLVAMVCLRIAGKFEEREEDVTGDMHGMLILADGSRVSAVEAFTRHLGDAAMSVSSAQVCERQKRNILRVSLPTNCAVTADTRVGNIRPRAVGLESFDRDSGSLPKLLRRSRGGFSRRPLEWPSAHRKDPPLREEIQRLFLQPLLAGLFLCSGVTCFQ